ncbi:MAG: hypothetical protein D6743_14810 [Calditrichaeota bacterium]|nr:MAG: hypothetical protein D6743_14810 [Calditrichota bacterium]
MEEIPAQWRRIDVGGLEGPILILGASDVGKSTFARTLYLRAEAAGKSVAYLDGDPGQATLGLPGTLTLALPDRERPGFPPAGKRWSRFIGGTSPVGHMLPVLVALKSLLDLAASAGVTATICDTTGLVDAKQGGVVLKLAKVDLLRPTAVLALQRGTELKPILEPLKRTGWTRVVELPVSPAARQRTRAERRRYRAAKLAAYFESAQPVVLRWNELAVLPFPLFRSHQLLALENKSGFVLGLGIVRSFSRTEKTVEVLTPVKDLGKLSALRLGDMAVDPHTSLDRPLN